MTTVVFMVPLLVARWGTRGEVRTGPNPAQRSFAESDFYAGKMMDLVLPWTGHRLDPLAFLGFAYNTSSRATVETSALGVIGAVGWVALVVVALTSVLGVKRPKVLRQWSVLTLVATALYTVGGLGAWVALFVTPQVRTWSRVSLYLLLLSLLLVGWWLTRLETAARSRSWPAAVALGLVVVGVLDQTNPGRAPDHAATRPGSQGAQQYTAALESRLGRGCPVFQLPVVPFPESSGIGEMESYDQLIPYLASDDLQVQHRSHAGHGGRRLAAGCRPRPARPPRRRARRGRLLRAGGRHPGLRRDHRPARCARHCARAPRSRRATTASTSPTPCRRAPSGPAGKDAPVLHPVLVALDAYEIQHDGTSMAQWVGPDVGLRVVNLGDTHGAGDHLDDGRGSRQHPARADHDRSRRDGGRPAAAGPPWARRRSR